MYDVIIITETWLCVDISIEELQLHNYIVFRSDRNINSSEKLRGGGALYNCY